MPAASRPGFCGATAAVRKAAPVHPTMVVPISIDATAPFAQALSFMALPIPGRRRARQFAGQPGHLRQAGKKLGRASWRERGGPLVGLWVVAISIRNKKVHTTK